MSQQEQTLDENAAPAVNSSQKSVADETFTFWLQNQPNTNNNKKTKKNKKNNSDNVNNADDASISSPAAHSTQTLLSHSDCPLPTIDQVLSTVSTFQSLAQQDTDYLSKHSSALVKVRNEVCSCKHQIDDMSESDYRKFRDAVFPLGKSGPMSKNVQNRAAYKLLESMEEVGITKELFGDVEAVRQKVKDVKAADRAKRAKVEKGARSRLSAKEKKKLSKKLVKIKPRDVVFVDVAGGPGGFSQAILDEVPKLPNTKVRGYGITLDFVSDTGCDLNWYPKLKKRRDFTPTYGLDGTGDVYKPENVESLVSICSFEKKIHFVMEDGGFEVGTDQLTMQESITSRLVYAQWYIALRLLSEGGSLVLKLFETSSVFLRSMLLLSCLFFRKVAIVKPAHSRVINSERYLSCSGFRSDMFTNDWKIFLQQVHARAFSQEGKAPFTLLPNMSLVLLGDDERNHSAVVENILKNLEESIITTAERQVIGFQMIFAEREKSKLAPSSSAEDEKTNINDEKEDNAEALNDNDKESGENQQTDE